MAPLPYCFRNFLLIYVLFASSFFVFASSQIHHQQNIQSHTFFLARRNLLEKSEKLQNEDSPKNNKKSLISSSSSSSKNQTKTIKLSPSFKNQTKSTSKSISGSKKNQTKSLKPTTSPKNISKIVGAPTTTTLTKLNLTKNLNSTKSLDLKSKTNKTKSLGNPIKEEITKSPSSNIKNKQEKTQKQKQKTPSPPTWIYKEEEDDDDDFMAEFRDLPTNFHKTFIPDLQRISTTSKIYLTKANKEITKTYIKPYVGHKYASSVTTAISCAFIVVPFLLVSLIFNRIKAYFSLQKLLIFIQIYLSIYFSILCLSCLLTGLEPLKFFYATSQSTYVWLQVLQTLGYVFYLLMLLMYLVLVFSTETGLGQKFLGLAQTFVGFSVGLHYYMTVFHRVVLRQPPKTNWKVHGIYATCFLVICLFAHAERRKKVYFEDGGEEGKQS